MSLAAIVALAALPSGAALAGEAPDKPAATAEEPFALDPNAFDIPQTAPKQDYDRFKFSKSDENKPDLKFPDQINFGNHVLRFDTNRKAVDTIPRVGVEAADQSIINRGASESSLTPNYFGLTLTTPTH